MIYKKISVIFGLCVLWGIQSQHYVEYDTPNIPVCYLNGGYYGIEEEGDYQIISRLDDTFVYYGTIEIYNPNSRIGETEDLDLTTKAPMYMNIKIYVHKSDDTHIYAKMRENKFIKLYYSS